MALALPHKALVDAMARLLRADQVLAGAAQERAYDCDAYTVDRSAPSVVVLPESTEEVAAIVRWCVENEQPYTPRGAGTGLSGGTMPALGGVVISLKRMNRILEIELPNRRLNAQAGIANAKITAAVKADGLHFAPDPSSQTVSTLGGNIAENSGGPHTLKYGVTAPHILEITMVSPSGEIVRLSAERPGVNIVSVIVGSEGTLGVVTEAWVKLTPLPESVGTMLAAFRTVRDASECVSTLMARGLLPAALEMMDKNILSALKAAFGLEFPEGTGALLLVECDGAPESVQQEMRIAQDVFAEHHAISFSVAEDEVARQKLWTARKKGVGAMGRLAPSVVTHDGVIPRSKLPEMLDHIYEVSERHGIGVANLFHAGDGNLHPIFYFDDRDPAQIEAVVAAGEEVIRRCIELGGSVTGEHGIGIEKLDLMRLMFSEADLALQARVKAALNPTPLCNPCKVLPNQRGCVEHMRRWRGVAT
ncbi:MAG: FAD-binding protein [Chthonomonas sp.]|nr:FAD-binding protein [Chthonomonas sp.]